MRAPLLLDAKETPVALSRDSTLVVTFRSLGQTEGEYRLREVVSGRVRFSKRVVSLAVPGLMRAVRDGEQPPRAAISADNSLIAVVTGKCSDGSEEGQVEGSEFSVVVLRAGDGSEHQRLDGHKTAVTALAFAPSQKWIASGSVLIRIWDVDRGEVHATLAGHSAEVRSLEFALSGDRLFSASDDHTVRVWDTALKNQLLAIRHEGVLAHATLASRAGVLVVVEWFDGETRLHLLGADRRLDTTLARQIEKETRDRLEPIVDELIAKHLNLRSAFEHVPNELGPGEIACIRAGLAEREDHPAYVESPVWKTLIQSGVEASRSHAAAVRRIERTHRVAPRSLAIQCTLALGYYRVGRVGEAVSLLDKVEAALRQRGDRLGLSPRHRFTMRALHALIAKQNGLESRVESELKSLRQEIQSDRLFESRKQLLRGIIAEIEE